MPQQDPMALLGGLAQMFAMFEGLQNQDEKMAFDQQQFEASQGQLARTNEFTDRELGQRERGLANQTRELELRGREVDSNTAYRNAAMEDAKRGRYIETERNDIQRDAMAGELANRELMNLTNLFQLVSSLQASMPNDGRVKSLGYGLMDVVAGKFGVALPDTAASPEDQNKLKALGGSSPVGGYAPTGNNQNIGG